MKAGNQIQSKENKNRSCTRNSEIYWYAGAQQNERSALTLLALIDVKSETQWEDANNSLIGITPIMNFAA